MILIVTHVDSKTGISVTKAPLVNGPKLPDLPSLKVLWSKSSKFPTTVPEYVVEVDDGEYSETSGVLAILTQEEADLQYQQELEDRKVKEYNLKANPIRDMRNRLLDESDKYTMVDFPITDSKRQEWFLYRAALRDITLQNTFPDEVVWPEKPV